MATRTITLIATDSLEHAHADWWRPIADHWPAGAAPPSLQLLPLADALADGSTVTGSAAVAILPRADASATILADALAEEGIPALFLFPTIDERASRLNSDTVIVESSSADPIVLAANIRALLQRQQFVSALLQELGANRRCTTGLRGQMDRVHEELQLAAQVQRDFLPRTLPTLRGAEFGVLYRPAGYVSGDIYDVQRLDEHHVAFFLADAIGHGVPAALMTMVVCKSLPMKDIVGNSYRLVPPGEALTRLNIELIRRQGESPRFASAVYGLIDTRSATVTIAGAGHPPPLRIRPGDPIERVHTEGGLLGVFAEETYDQVTFTLQPDEVLMLHSDGFETAFPDPAADNYGRRLPTTHYLDHFGAFANDLANSRNIALAMTRLADRLDEQTGSLHQRDDLTALALLANPVRATDEVLNPAVRTVTPA